MARTRRAAPVATSAPSTKANSRPAAALPPKDDGERAERRGRSRTATRSSRTSLSISEHEGIREANFSREAALERLAAEDPTTSGNTFDDDDSASPVEIGRRAEATPAQRRDTTGLDLADDSVFGDLDDSFERDDVSQAARSAETTSASLSNFKPRSRKSSFVGRNDPPIRPSSRGGTTPSISSAFNIGLFKRRAREPSILGATRKPRADVTASTATAQNSDVEREEDFAPEAVSTPLHNRRSTRSGEGLGRQVPSRELAKPQTRKRKSDEALEDSERPEKASRTEPETAPSDDNDSDLSSLPSPQHQLASLPPRPVTPISQDEIIAPPASSGSEDETDMWPDIHILARRRRRPSVTSPPRADNLSDISSPPSLTHSPNFAEAEGTKSRGRAAKRHRASPKMTTADLAELLPKRRYHKNRDSFALDSDEEVDTSGLGQDDDELSHVNAKTARRARGGRRNPSALKPKQTVASTTPTRRSARGKANGRRSSDKENANESEEEASGFMPMPDDTFDTSSGVAVGSTGTDELKNASKKFKEVDQWKLEYEEVMPTSSPQGAR